MKAFSFVRSTLLRFAVAALVLIAGCAAFVSASSLPKSGETGNALALRAMIHPGAARSAWAHYLQAARISHLPNGRYLQEYPEADGTSRRAFAITNANPILEDEGVQTFDVFAPPPSFTPQPTLPLNATNLTPVWSADESYIVFSSNLGGDGHFHLYGVAAGGDTPPAGSTTPAIFQITSGTGNEYYPAFNSTNGSLAFTSDANSAGNQQLYVIGGSSGVAYTAGQAAINVATLAGNTGSAKTLGDAGFANVTHPTWDPGGDALAFAATTTTGTNTGKTHLYFLYTSTNGYQETQGIGSTNPPAQLTDGPANDADPAWSPGTTGTDYIAFDSTATSVASTGSGYGPGVTPAVTAGNNATRGLFLITGLGASAPGAVPPGLNANNRIDATGSDDYGPAWSFPQSNQYTNPAGDLEYLCFARATAANTSHGVYYFPLLKRDAATANVTTFSPETAAGGSNAAVHISTNDAAGTFDDVYPTFAPFRSIFNIVYQSGSVANVAGVPAITGGVPLVRGGRSITYNLAGNIPEETPTSIPDGTTVNGVPIGTAYSGIFESQVLNLDPPTLLRYSGSEAIHVQNSAGATTKHVQPGTAATFVVRLSNREAGIDNTNGPNGGPNVYLQIKNPNSKYQGQDGIEHKVFADSNDIDLTTGASLDSGASSRLFNGGAGIYSFNVPAFAGYNIINNVYLLQSGSVGGVDGSDTIAVGHTSAVPSGDPPQTADLSTYRPWGPEYECQYLNPQFATAAAGGNVDASATDYGVPFYLAGFDDQSAFSGSSHPHRPVVNTAAQPAVPAMNGNPATPAVPAKPAEWLQLTALPAAQQDGQGGVLYSATFTTPTTPSDFYVDVIAYDNAVFPALPAADSGYVGLSKNWRIYDNIGGFTTQTFSGDNDILIVSDYALGQKFAATTFGGRNGNSNLQPTFYGAESYYTDVDEALLPNATDHYMMLTLPTAPVIPAQVNTAMPTQVSATPGVGSVTVEWAGNFSPTYNVYRATVANPVFPTDYTNIAQVAGMTTGTAQTSYTDTGLTNGNTYTYVVTSVSANNRESGPSNPPVSTTPANFGSTNHVSDFFSLNGGSGNDALAGNGDDYPNVQNGLGVGSYNDSMIDDGGTVATATAAPGDNLPSGLLRVPYVNSQKYSLWRILSRGPVPAAVLAGYEPSFVSQPAVADTVNGVTAVAGTNIPVANRCVIWVSPYTGNLPIVDAGSLENPTTQQTLQSFVNAGGRLCITGANVASALTVKGSTANTFLTKTLGANFATQAGGSQILAGASDRLTGSPGFNGGIGYYTIAVPAGVASSPVSAAALLLGSNYDSTPNWRTDGSLDMLGPNASPFLSNGIGNNAVAQINTITPTTGTTDITTGGAAGLIYHEDYTDAVGAGYGSRVVFGSFGLEGIGIEYFKYTGTDMKTHYAPVNQRPKILHNIVCYLRTGTFTGRITQASGQGVPGATVYLRPNGGTIPGPRQVFSGTTGFDGNYTISGVEPGVYAVVAYAQGFTTTVSNVHYGVEGDADTAVNLTIAPTPPGAITGVVTDSVTKVGIPGVTVTFKSVNGQTTVSGVTTPAGGGLPAGSYSIANVPAGPYNGTASLLPAYATATAPTEGNPITVPSGSTATANFTLTSKPATVSGTVFSDLNGNGTQDTGEPGVVGATVTLVPTATGGVTPTAVKTGAGGAYTVTGVATGTYTITVVANGFVTSASRTVTVTAGATITGENVPLVVAPPTQPGTLGGLVTDAVSGNPIAGATVTLTTSTGVAVTDINGNTVVATTTTGTTSSPTAPTGDGSPLNYSFTNLPAGTYTVTVTDGGYGTQTLSTLTVTAGAFTRADFTAANGNALEPIHVFPGGQFSFFSLPTDYSGGGVAFVNALFGPLNLGTFSPLALNPSNANRSHLYVYNPTLLQYITDPTPSADGLHIGQGYWVYLVKPSELTSVGASPTTATVPVALARGWNMIGVPSTSAITVSRLTFANATGGGAVSFSDATSSAYHLILPTLYGFDGTEYNTLTATGSLQPYHAYWIYAYAATTVLIPTTGG